MLTDNADTWSDRRAPKTMRLNRSRPKESAPSGCDHDGPAMRLAPTICSGFLSGSQSAVSARTT